MWHTDNVHNLINHYKYVHEWDYSICNSSLKTEEDFFNWKAETEKSTSSEFVKHCGNRNSKETINSYYYCNRSGTLEKTVPDQDKKRCKRTSRSCKSAPALRSCLVKALLGTTPTPSP